MITLPESLNSYRMDLSNPEKPTEGLPFCQMEIIGEARSQRSVVIDLAIPAQRGKIKTALKGQVTIPLVCPEKDCGGTHIWKDGYDYQTKTPQQMLQCAKDRRKFYVHTSGYFEAMTNTLAEEFLKALLVEGVPLKALADRYQISEASLSEAARDFRAYLFKRLSFGRGDEGNGEGEAQIPKTALRAPNARFLGQLGKQGTTLILRGQCHQEYLIPFTADQNGLLIVDVAFYAIGH